MRVRGGRGVRECACVCGGGCVSVRVRVCVCVYRDCVEIFSLLSPDAAEFRENPGTPQALGLSRVQKIV